MKPLFSVIHPTARPNGWQVVACAYRYGARRPQLMEYILSIDREQVLDFGAIPPWIRVVVNTGRRCVVDATNVAADLAAGQIWLIASDDMLPPDRWDELLAAVIPDPAGEYVVKVSDGVQHMNMQILTRARYQRLGYVFHPDYLSMWADLEFTEVAWRDGVVIDAPHIHFEHRHHSLGGIPADEVTHRHESADRHAVGRAAFDRRKAEGFPRGDHGTTTRHTQT